MKYLYEILKQIRHNIWRILLIFLVSAIPLGMVVTLHLWKGIYIGTLTRDPLSIMNGNFYVGFLSQAGIFIWASAAAICLFTAYVRIHRSKPRHLTIFLFVSGLLSLFLGLDDVFLLHEEFYPAIGIPQEPVYISYFLLVVLWLVTYRTTILNTDYILLVNALLFLGGSVLIDIIDISVLIGIIDIIPHQILMEDGAKLIGMISWFTYFFLTSVHAISNSTLQGIPAE